MLNNNSTIHKLSCIHNMFTLTSYTAPSEVTNFLVGVLSDTSLIIFWGPPERPNGILTHYAYTVSDNPAALGPEQTTAANDSQPQYTIRVDSLSKLSMKDSIIAE